MEGNLDNANFGSEVASAGDVNNDGFDDIIVGAHKYEDGMADEGAAFIFHGSATGIITTPVTMLQNNDVLAYFGIAVRGAGDFNQDGYDDVMVGSILFENGSSAEGSAYLYKGSASGIKTTPYLTIEGNQSEVNMGRSVSGAGDVNNDGFPDVMASANFYDNGQLNEGVVYVYHMCTDSLYADLDGDGFGDPLNLVNICNDTINLVEDNTDCDDTNASIYPGSIEICNSLDDDCNTLIDEGLIFEIYYVDADADFFGDVNDAGTSACLPIAGTVAPEGTVTNNTDCDDSNGDVNSAETEICNLIDDNCDGFIDEGFEVFITTTALSGTTFCQGGSVVLEASHNGIALQWKKNGAIIPGATSTTYTATKTGTYTCEASNLCNTAISTGIVVTANKNPNANITADGPTTFCPGDNVNLNVTPVGGSAYQWYKGPTPIAGATSLSYTATTSGNYKCRVTKIATGCYKNSNTIPVNVMCKELVVSTENNFTIFPNPATQEITITSEDVSAKSIYIIDAVGQVVQTILTEQTSINIDIQPYANGVYFIKINSEAGSITKSFVKE
jgi:hypothetical protein